MAEKIKIVVSLDPDDVKKGGKDVVGVLEDIKGSSKSAGKEASKMSASTVSAGQLMAQAYTFVAQRAMQVVNQTRELAFTVEETGSKYKTVLGPNIHRANKFLSENAGLLGITTTQGQEYVSTAVQISKGLKMNAGDATDFGIEWTKLAGDFQSFFNVPYEQGFNAIRSGLVGEQEPLKQFGIVLTEAETKERALLTTGKEREDQLTNLEKVQARYSLIVEKAGTAVGDLERTQNSGANTTRRMETAYREIAEQMAARSIPLWNEIARSGLEFSGVLKDILNLNVSDKLQQERVELNVLASQLIRATEAGKDRTRFITQLNEKYPEYLKNLSEEEQTSENLRDRLEELNELYVDRIALQLADEDQKDRLRKASNALNDQYQAEFQLNKMLINLNEEYGFGLDVTKYSTEELAKVTKSLLSEKAEFTESARLGKIATNDEASSLGTLNLQIQRVTAATTRAKEEQEEATIAAEAYQKTIEQLKASGSGALDPPEDQSPSQNQTIEIPVKPFIDPSVPVDQIFEDSLTGTLPEFKVAPRIETGSLSFLQDALASAEEQYTNAATSEERKRHQERISKLEIEIQAKEAGISYEQQLRRDAHQENMQMAIDYVNQVNQGFQLISQFQGAITERRIQNTEREQDKALSAIDARLQNDKLSEQQRELLVKKREQVEEKYQKKIDKLQREQFERERIAKLAEVAANTAVAVAKVWGQTGIFGVGAQAAPLAMGALQAGVILAQPNPYLEGGLLAERLNNGMTTPGKKLISINENNKPEYIMNAVSTAKSLPILNRMNKDPEYASQINKAALSPKPPEFSKPNISVLNTGIDNSAIQKAVSDGISEAMAGVNLIAKMSIKDFMQSQDDFRRNEDFVGNQS